MRKARGKDEKGNRGITALVVVLIHPSQNSKRNSGTEMAFKSVNLRGGGSEITMNNRISEPDY